MTTIPIESPQGPWYPQDGQTYVTPWFLQRGLRPMGAPHPGHGNDVEPVSSKGRPDDVQFVALSLMMDPQEHFAHALPFFMVACSITSFALVTTGLR